MSGPGRRYHSTSFDFRISYPTHWSTHEYDLPKPKRYDEDEDTDTKQEDTSTPLKVKTLDLNVASNTKNHQTDMYEMTEDRKDKEGDMVPSQLVVRRGKEFTVSLTFHREVTKDDKIRLVLQIGDRPLVSKGTSVHLTPDYMLRPRHWSCSLQSTKADKMTLAILTPPNCLVGRWRLTIETWIDTETGNVQVFKYTHKHPIFVIFNPFCKDDQVYLADQIAVDEYILNDSGKIYTGTATQPTYKPWNYSQFESPLLECCMSLLERSRLNLQSRGDPVSVVRVISAMVNSADDNGVLTGNWSGNYSDGTAPSHWTGSGPILRQYYETKEPVCYGQCWVFSGVSTTICRALGIPARSVTNYKSAHDCDGSISIDVHWNEKGEPLDEMNEDSVWNFHVWNEAWMSRPDLDPGYSGWQVFDATPQETSSGVYCAGPVSVEAIKNGQVNLPYDGRFVFAEVNADKVHWVLQKDGDWRKIIEKNVVGQKISTKLPRMSTESFWNSYMHKDEKERLDLTSDYKYPEGTEAERAVVLRANLYSTRPDIYDHGDEDVKFDLRHKDDVLVGNTFDVTLRAQNTSRKLRSVHAVMTVKSVYYTGVVHRSVIKKEIFDFEVAGIRADEVVMRISFEEYQHVIVDQVSFLIDVLTTVSETNQMTPLQDVYRLRRPDLQIKAPQTVRVGETFDVIIRLDSPMPINLTNSQWMVDGPGLQTLLQQPHKDLEPYDSAELKLSLVAKKAGQRALVASFDSRELRDVSGSVLIQVEE